MAIGIHNYSEIGKLNKVLLHRIGTEIDGLVPDNFERLLFDDIPYLRVPPDSMDMSLSKPLELVMDTEAQRPAGHRVPKSQTRLSH